MLLDRLLARLDTRVELFSVCLVGAGWRLRLPGPPAAMLHFVLEGKGWLRSAGGAERPLRSGTLAVVSKGSTHAVASADETHREHRVDVAAEDGATDPPVIVAGDALVEELSEIPRARSVFEDLLAEQKDPRPRGPAMQAALMSQCLVLLLRRLCEKGECGLPWISALVDPRLARALERILEDPAKPFTVELLAVEAAMSRSAFAESFTNAFGMPPMTMVHRVRLERARHLMERDGSLSMGAVARRVGYASRSHFYRAFKKRYGVPPAALRALASEV